MSTDSTSSRARRRRETRRLLLDTAEELFCRDGYAATTMERIAMTAGFTTGAIYANFPNKEGLFLALQEDRGQRFAADSRAWIPTGASLEVRLHAFGHHIGALAIKNRAWALVAAEFWAQAARRPELAEALADIHAKNRAELAGIIRDVLAAYAQVDPEAVQRTTWQVLALIEGLAVQTYVDESTDYVTVFADGFLKLSAPLRTSTPSSRSRRSAPRGAT